VYKVISKLTANPHPATRSLFNLVLPLSMARSSNTEPTPAARIHRAHSTKHALSPLAAALLQCTHDDNSSAEEFDLNVVVESENEEAEPGTPVAARPTVQVSKASNPTNKVAAGPPVFPVHDTDSSASGNVAHDIIYFFRRGSKADPAAKTVCIRCE
jgi:hypothetical protein